MKILGLTAFLIVQISYAAEIDKVEDFKAIEQFSNKSHRFQECFQLDNYDFNLCRRIYIESFGQESEVYYRKNKEDQLLPLYQFSVSAEYSISYRVLFSEEQNFIAITRRNGQKQEPFDEKKLSSYIYIFNLKEFINEKKDAKPDLIIKDPLADKIRLFNRDGSGTYLLKTSNSGCVAICPIEVTGTHCEKSFSL